MPKALSLDLRQRVVNAYLAGEGTYGEIAQKFQVGVATVNRWLRLKREKGHVQARSYIPGPKRRIDEQGVDLLKKLIERKPDITLAELSQEYAHSKKIRPALSMIWRALNGAGISRKKRLPMHPSNKPLAFS